MTTDLQTVLQEGRKRCGRKHERITGVLLGRRVASVLVATCGPEGWVGGGVSVLRWQLTTPRQTPQEAAPLQPTQSPGQQPHIAPYKPPHSCIHEPELGVKRSRACLTPALFAARLAQMHSTCTRDRAINGGTDRDA